MKLIFGVTLRDENPYMILNTFKNQPHDNWEMVVLHDARRVGGSPTKVSDELKQQLDIPGIHTYSEPFLGDFAQHKNRLNELCESHGADYICQIDGDEFLPFKLADDINSIIEKYLVDLIWVPRLNYVSGITPEHVQKWGWRYVTLDKYGSVVNWPDYQGRIYKAGMRWEGKVHERITNHKTYIRLPMEPSLAINHMKTIEKQEAQNKLYEEMMK